MGRRRRTERDGGRRSSDLQGPERHVASTVVVIEHHLDVVKYADYVVNLGPGGGDAGGRVVAGGAPEVIANNKRASRDRFGGGASGVAISAHYAGHRHLVRALRQSLECRHDSSSSGEIQFSSRARGLGVPTHHFALAEIFVPS